MEMREKIEAVQDEQCVLVIAGEKIHTILGRNERLRSMLALEVHEESIIEQQND